MGATRIYDFSDINGIDEMSGHIKIDNYNRELGNNDCVSEWNAAHWRERMGTNQMLFVKELREVGSEAQAVWRQFVEGDKVLSDVMP